jgi:hypothetical protein
MDVDEDDKVIELKRSASNELADDYDGQAAQEPPGDAHAAIPRRADPYDKAYARPSGRVVPGLCLVLADGTRRSYPYSGRVGGPDWYDTPAGVVIIQRFSDVVPVETAILGHRLDELYELLFYQKMPWVRAVPSGKLVQDRGTPIITRALVRRWKPDTGGLPGGQTASKADTEDGH